MAGRRVQSERSPESLSEDSIVQGSCPLLGTLPPQILRSFASLGTLWEPFSRYQDCPMSSWLNSFLGQAWQASPWGVVFISHCPLGQLWAPPLSLKQKCKQRRQLFFGRRTEHQWKFTRSSPWFLGSPAVGAEAHIPNFCNLPGPDMISFSVALFLLLFSLFCFLLTYSFPQGGKQTNNCLSPLRTPSPDHHSSLMDCLTVPAKLPSTDLRLTLLIKEDPA